MNKKNADDINTINVIINQKKQLVNINQTEIIKHIQNISCRLLDSRFTYKNQKKIPIAIVLDLDQVLINSLHRLSEQNYKLHSQNIREKTNHQLQNILNLDFWLNNPILAYEDQITSFGQEIKKNIDIIKLNQILIGTTNRLFSNLENNYQLIGINYLDMVLYNHSDVQPDETTQIKQRHASILKDLPIYIESVFDDSEKVINAKQFTNIDDHNQMTNYYLIDLYHNPQKIIKYIKC